VIVFLRNESPIHSALKIPGVPGPHTAVRDNPSDRYGKVLVISGETGEQLLTAARAIATGSYPKSSDSASLGDFQMSSPSLPPYNSPRWLDAAGRNTLGAELNLEDLKVYGSGSVNLYFRLAPDLYFGRRSYIPFRFRYRLNKWPSGTLAHISFRLNGVPINSRRLPEAAGTNPQTELIGLPVQQLQAANTLTVEFVIDNKRSQAVQTYAEESVLRDSMIDLSGLDHFTEMPRLDLFVNAGYPFTKYADLSHTAIVLPVNLAPQQISLFLSILGFFGARTGFPALRTTVLYPDQLRMGLEKDVLALNPSAYTSQLVDLSGSVRMKDGRVDLSNSRGPLDRIPWTRESTERGRATAIINADPTPEGFVSQFESPLKSGSSVVAIDTVDATNGEAFEQLFVKGTGVSKVYGSVSILQGGLLHSFNIGQASYSTGHLRGDERTRIWINRHYFTIPPILFLIAFLIAAGVNTYLEAKVRARLEWASGSNAV
jgi:cellulose synthase (UDP-forming)